MTEAHKAFLKKHGLEKKELRKLQHAEVRDSQTLEKYIEEGYLSFSIQTIYSLTSDGMDGANLTKPYTFLGYSFKDWSCYKPRTPEMLKTAREFMLSKDLEEEMKEILSNKMHLTGYSLNKQGSRWEITLNMKENTVLVRASDIEEFKRVVITGISKLKEHK